MQPQRPTIGRIVHYCIRLENILAVEAGHKPFARLVPLAAMIVDVPLNHDGQDYGNASLVVFNRDDGSGSFKRNVEFSDLYAAGCWSWPPREPAPMAMSPARAGG